MTQFNKADFDYHGGYLMYRGDYEGRPVYEDSPNIHPSNIGLGIDLFVARFKYGGPFPKAKFMKELMKSFTVEEYVEARSKDTLESSPLGVLKAKNPKWYADTINAYAEKKGLDFRA